MASSLSDNPLGYLGAPDASTTIKGISRLATTAETTAGTRTDLACTPAGVAAVAIAGAPDASTTVKGIVELATNAEAAAKTDTVRAMTPSNVASIMAAPGAIGGTTPAAGTFTTLTTSSTVAMTGGTFSVGADNAANAITLGSGTTARTITIGGSTGAHVLVLGNANAGAITLDTAAGISLDAATASNFSVSGAAADLTLASSAGSVNITAGEDAANAIVLTASAGGIDILATGEAAQDIDIVNTGGSINITATEDVANAVYIRANGGTSETIRIHADQGTGVASLDLLSDVGGISLTSGLASADAINLAASAGGVDIDGALQVNIASSQNAASAIVIAASAGGIDITATGAAAEDLDLVCTNGSTNISAGEAAADAITLQASAGGVDIDGALQVNIASSQAAATAIRINASDAAGGIDIDDAGGGTTIDSVAGVSIDAATASNFSVTGASQDLTLASVGGSVIISATESAVDAIKIQSTTGGIDILASGAAAGEDIDIVATGSSVNITSSEDAADAIVLTASAGGIDILATGEAGQDIDIVNTGGSVNISATENDAGAIYIHADGGASERIQLRADQGTGADSVYLLSDAGGIKLEAAGDITISGTVKEIDAEFLYSSGTDLVVSQSPICQSNANTGVAPTGSNGDVNLMYMQDGCLMEQFIIGTQTIIAPRMNANGLNLALDNTAAEGSEYNFGARNNAKHAYTIGTSPAFFMTAKFYVEDLSGCDPLMIGFRKVEANNATLASYTDYALIGLNQGTSATNVVMLTELNAGGQTATDSTDAWGGDGSAQTVTVKVSAAGVVTFEVNGVAATVAPSFTFDNGDVVMPIIHFVQGADITTDVDLQTLKIGYQA